MGKYYVKNNSERNPMKVKEKIFVMSVLVLSFILLPIVDADAVSDRGLTVIKDGAVEEYTLFAPLSSTTTYLIDLNGNVVHSWVGESNPGNCVYLLENRYLLRTETVRSKACRSFPNGGRGGRVKLMDCDGNIVWQYTLAEDDICLHHDVEYMSNGNILIITWERISRDDAISAGRNPNLIKSDYIFVDKIIEVEPNLDDGSAEIDWEWRLMDHLIQDYDNKKENYGRVFRHPELIDFNFTANGIENPANPDWTHINTVDYNEQLDQVVISSPHHAEVYIIDHIESGDILFRWGNPMAYRAGDEQKWTLFFQHDIQWIDEGLYGDGNLLVFNNGTRTTGRNYSSVDEFKPAIEGNTYKMGNYSYLPSELEWRYTADPRSDFYSDHISGVQRLPCGNTLICSGADGRLFEVTTDGEVVWEYLNPFSDSPKNTKTKLFRVQMQKVRV
jgi:hypothetical protein